jgi:hypothetical protein
MSDNGENGNVNHVYIPPSGYSHPPTGYGYGGGCGVGYGAGYGGMYPYFTGLQNQLLSNQVSNSNSQILDTIGTNSRLNGTEHGAIISEICSSKSDITGEVNSSGRANADLIHQTSVDNLKATYDATNVVGGAVRDNSLNNKEAIERNGIASRDAVERNGEATRDQVHRTSSNVKDQVTDFGNRNLMSIERNHGVSIATQERIAGELRNYLDRNNTTNLLAIKENTLEICKAKGDLERQAADNTAMLKYKSLKNKCELEKQASDNFAAIQTKAIENRAALAKQAAENHASSQLLAFQNKEALSKQLADCCCDLKQLVISQHCEIKENNYRDTTSILGKVSDESSETQLLIKSTEAEKIRDELNAVREQLRLFKSHHHSPPH